MFSYELYKLIHLVAVILFVASFSASLYGNAGSKLTKILGGVSTLFILVGGMGLLARIGVPHQGPYPVWVILKVASWLAVAILAPMLAKRVKSFKSLALLIVLSIMALAIYSAIYKIGPV
jgi:uncharacterized membrane protein SirB2